MTLSKPSIEQEEVDSRRFARNTAMSWLSSLVKGVSQLIMLPVMAHLLGPSAFGIYALAQQDEANTLIWSTAYWLLLFSISIMAVCVAASGYILSALTGHAELISVMLILSAALPLMAVSIAPDARILRRGDLSFHSMTEMVSTIVSSFVAIAAAFSGWSVWSLAFQYLSIY
ncbi:oligosaccharide flippase family protein, partial [Methylobacterium sp. WL7]|uniref:oligosaccharide flippase family protein n=1 Tax=Methylobacterium sp. WL7 TaxID=2603900 RepID=UPI0011C7DF28